MNRRSHPLLALGAALLVPGCGQRSDTQDPEQAAAAAAEPPALRVLYVENAPRWEYRYLERTLLRAPAIEFQSFLFTASDDFSQAASEGLPNLDALPSSAAELERYDVVLLGDVAPQQLAPDPRSRKQWLERLVAFVDAGGGLGFLSGPEAMPASYRGTPLEGLLPVELEPDRTGAAALAEPVADYVPHLADPAHPITALVDDPATNARLWHEGFPPLQTFCPVARAREGAEALLLHPGDSNEHGPRVVAAAMPHGRGRTFFLGTDDAWRWRRIYGAKYHDKVWIQAVRYLAGK